MILSEIDKIIREKDNFAIVAHTSPDGDSLGSTLGLFNFLRENNKSADVFLDGTVPYKYRFLPGVNEIVRIEERRDWYSCLFVLDSGDADRLGNCKELCDFAEVIVNIDHHMTNSQFGNFNFVDTKASSVGEMVYQLLHLNNYSISKEVASCLYTAIVTDTGGFKYSNTTQLTMQIAGELINSGIDFTEINRRAFDIKTVPQVKLMSRVISTLDIILDSRVALIYLTPDMLRECGAKEEDSSDFINIARDIEEVEVAVMIKEMDNNKSRVSLRSKKYVDVSKIAEIFSGGGHVRASGCTIEGDAFEARDILVKELKKALEGFRK